MWPEIHLHSLSSLISAEEPLYGIPLLPFPPSALRLHKDDLSPRCAITIFMLLFLPVWDWKYCNGLTLWEDPPPQGCSFLPLSYLGSVFSSVLCQHLSAPLCLHTAWLQQSWRLAEAAPSNWRGHLVKRKIQAIVKKEWRVERRGKLDWIFRQIYGSLIAMYLHNLNKCKCNIPLQSGYLVVTENCHISSVNMQTSISTWR